MMNSEQYWEHIERTFNAFCKIVLYHAALGAYKKLRKKQQFEVSLDYLREFDFEPVTTTDEYFVKYDVPTAFTVHGKTVIVESEQLAAALLRLTEKRREALLLQYYLGYNDEEIGKMCSISRSAVFRRRKIALRLLRKEMDVLKKKNRKYKLLPYETIVKATAGEPEAVNTVFQTYTGYIKYLSYFQGSINDDIQDYLKASLMEALPKFRFDR